MKSVMFRRSIALGFHFFGALLCYWLAFQLRFDFDTPEKSMHAFPQTCWWVVGSYMVAILAFGLYQGLWRFFTLRDCLTTLLALSCGSFLALGVVYLTNDYSFKGFPRSVFVVSFLLLLLWEIGWRGLVRLLREHRLGMVFSEQAVRRVLLIGHPDNADVLIRAMLQRPGELGKAVGVVSEKTSHQGLRMRGIPIFGGLERIPDCVISTGAKTLIFLAPCTGPRRIRGVMQSLTDDKLTCDFRVMPSIHDLAAGNLDTNHIRKVAIEDLLQRPSYMLDTKRVESRLKNKRILITGAGGSIGSEICRQLIQFRPKVMVLFDVSEFHLFQIENELRPLAIEAGVKLIGCTGDVRNEDQLRRAIRSGDGIDLFYHAAAYKHVDLMERNVVACFQNNVLGTYVSANVAESEGISDFVLISTDKAVRPTSMMGASKRLAERLLIERPPSVTSFRAVRFGNVLGSNGSVVPIFREQIARGGPVTVTSRKVTRFFMTIPESVELVLAAGAVDEDRRIFVLEMGEAIKIDSMARRMIELSGFVPDVDIPIEYTGLKSGEKEYEELLTDDEDVVRTVHDRIWVVKKGREVDAALLDIGELLELIDLGNSEEIREFAHSMVPGSLLKTARGTTERQ